MCMQVRNCPACKLMREARSGYVHERAAVQSTLHVSTAYFRNSAMLVC